MSSRNTQDCEVCKIYTLVLNDWRARYRVNVDATRAPFPTRHTFN